VNLATTINLVVAFLFNQSKNNYMLLFRLIIAVIMWILCANEFIQHHNSWAITCAIWVLNWLIVPRKD
jgi:hypothetical protein